MSKPVDSTSGAATVYAPQQEENKKSKVSFWQNVFVGSASGIAAVAFIQPMIHFKNAKQVKAMQKKEAPSSEGNSAQKSKPDSTKARFSINPRVWYRGGAGFAASFAPTIAIQTAAQGIFSHIFNPFVAATAAGAFSAVIVCPAEGIMNQQQKSGKSFFDTAKYIYTIYGVRGFYRAFFSTIMRESSFTAAYLGATPILKERIQSFGVNEWVAQGIAGVVAGVITAPFSQPFDTMKTQMQRDFAMNIPMIKVIFQRSAFAGLGWRTVIVATATVIMPTVQHMLNAHFEQA